MRVGLVGDTHVPEAAPDLPREAYAALAECDRILHCGDLHSIQVVDRLERLAPTMVARGNGDTYGPSGGRPGVDEDPRVVESLVFEVDGFRVGLTHDLVRATVCFDGACVHRRLRADPTCDPSAGVCLGTAERTWRRNHFTVTVELA